MLITYVGAALPQIAHVHARTICQCRHASIAYRYLHTLAVCTECHSVWRGWHTAPTYLAALQRHLISIHSPGIYIRFPKPCVVKLFISYRRMHVILIGVTCGSTYTYIRYQTISNACHSW